MSFQVINGDAKALPLPDASVDAIVTDPPYGLSFMGKEWDHGVPGVPFWAEALRVAKPGAMLLAFGGTRTYHRLTCAIEDAGWEIRDCLMWLYGTGFPKSHDISKAIDKAAGAEREVVGAYRVSGRAAQSCKEKGGTMTAGAPPSEGAVKDIEITAPATDEAAEWEGQGTALKPAWEPIILAMKPLDGTFAENALRHGVAGLNVDGCRIGTGEAWDEDDTPGTSLNGYGPADEDGWEGGWTKRSGSHPSGRWPANLVLSEPVDRAIDAQSGPVGGGSVSAYERAHHDYYSGSWPDSDGHPGHDEPGSGGASRFFYCAKASRSEREAGLEGFREKDAQKWNEGGIKARREAKGQGKRKNHHPTVKPLDLCGWLVRLVTRPEHTVLDPFMGSGSTGCAAAIEGRSFVGVDKNPEYCAIAEARIRHWDLKARSESGADPEAEIAAIERESPEDEPTLFAQVESKADSGEQEAA